MTKRDALGRSRGRVPWALPLAAVPVLLLIACGTSADDQTSAATRPSLSMHIVDRQTELPCPDEPPEGLLSFVGTVESGGEEACILVEPAVLTFDDIANATRVDTDDDDSVVDLELKAGGHEKLVMAARRNVGRRLAIVVNNRVVSAPVIETTELANTVRTGGLSAAEATLLVRFFEGAESPTADDSSSQDRVALSKELCSRLADREGFEQGTASSRPMTAGEVVDSLEAVGADTAPWETLAVDHFVASCSFMTVDESPNTTVCPDGTIGVTDQPEQFYVDEDGRQTTDPVVDAVDLQPCA